MIPTYILLQSLRRKRNGARNRRSLRRKLRELQAIAREALGLASDAVGIVALYASQSVLRSRLRPADPPAR
jgi:hypothetical protein